MSRRKRRGEPFPDAEAEVRDPAGSRESRKRFPLPFSPADGLRRLAVSVGGLGYVPLMPGTAASAAALAVGLAVLAWAPQPVWVLAGLIVLSVAVGFALTGWAERVAKEKDPVWFVLDETAGMWVAMWALPGGWHAALAAFVLFRLLDIAKPPPVKQAERLLGAAGIMLDDLVAGVLANVVVRLVWLVAG